MPKKKAKKQASSKKKRSPKRVRVLPRKMSSLIKIALADMRKVEANKEKFLIDMSGWVTPITLNWITLNGHVLKRESRCAVCAAGSVMAFTLKAKGDQLLSPDAFPKNALQLRAIDHLRRGRVAVAADVLGLVANRSDKNYSDFADHEMTIADYDEGNPEPFHRDMTKLAKRLEKAGL